MLAERYSFLQSPQSSQELDLQKGIDLAVGKLGDINIDKLSIFANGVVVDTRSSTDDCDRVIEDLLRFIQQAFGATVRSTREMTLSQIVFESDLRLARLNAVLEPIASRVAAAISRDFRQEVSVEPISISINADLSQIKLQPHAFTIERRVDTPFNANLYFSAAPIRTAEHLELVSQMEAALL